jgi:hypothetical protein
MSTSAKIRFVTERKILLNDWEKKFITDVFARELLTSKQLKTVDMLYSKVLKGMRQ